MYSTAYPGHTHTPSYAMHSAERIPIGEGLVGEKLSNHDMLVHVLYSYGSNPI
jgi:hypothetical protein